MPTFTTVPKEEAEAKVAAAPAQKPAAWVYFVKTTPRQGPFDTVHEALRALGVSQADIDAHKYWHRLDRLPKKHADAIEKQAK